MWPHDFYRKYFLMCNFSLEMSTSTQVVKLKCHRKKFDKKIVQLLDQNTFLEKVT